MYAVPADVKSLFVRATLICITLAQQAIGKQQNADNE